MILEFSRTFLTEEGQRLHGLGVDAIAESPQRSKTWFLNSHKREKFSNSLVIKDLARLYLSEQRCSQALNLLEVALNLVPFDPGVISYRWEALECLDRGSEAFEDMTEERFAELSFQKNLFIEIYKIRNDVRGGQLEQARLKLKRLKKDHPRFPEASFWLWKLDPKEGQIDISHAREYVKLCQRLSVRYRTELFRQGFVCSKTEVVDAFLKQSGI
ncbi:MAG: hypothetical protein AAF202_05055 [Pseudomonadota bacterium]